LFSMPRKWKYFLNQKRGNENESLAILGY